MIPLSQVTIDCIENLFNTDENCSEVFRVLEFECGDNLPMVETEWTEQAERIRFAVLKLSQGSIQCLYEAIDGAKSTGATLS